MVERPMILFLEQLCKGGGSGTYEPSGTIVYTIMQTPNLLRNLIESDLLAFERMYQKNPSRWQNIRMNIEGFGLQASVPSIWGAFREGKILCGILMRFSTTVVVVDTEGECAALFAQYIDRSSGLSSVRGSLEVVNALSPLLQAFDIVGREMSHFMQLQKILPPPAKESHPARPATLADLEPLSALYARADRMYRSRSNIASKLGKERVFVVEEPEKSPCRIVSSALLNVEASDTALVGGVFTLPEARGRGYATACVSALCHDLQKEGKTPYLFYENPSAGRIYRGLGFHVIDSWVLLFLNSRHKQGGDKK